MRRSLQVKLILSYLAVALITVLVVSVLIRVTSGQSLMNFVIEQQTALMEENVQTYYSTNGNLEGFYGEYFRTTTPQPGAAPPGGSGRPPEKREVRGVRNVLDAEFHALIPMPGIDIGQVVPENMRTGLVPVKVDGETVAWILPDTRPQLQLNPEEELFLNRTTLAIGLAALAGMGIAVAMGFLLSGRLLKPIRRLTQASQKLARGALHQQIPVTSQDELGQLTDTFNQMSVELLKADQQRKQMTADITHDLSTPLQIISGYIEMVEADSSVLTPDRIEILKREIEHLRRLVGDLTILSQVEGGGLEIELQPVNPISLLEQIYRTYQPVAAREGVEIVVEKPDYPTIVLVDEGRMLQVLQNLVDNALRHTPRDGRIRLEVLAGNPAGKPVLLQVADNGSGIEAEDLPYVFDRFYQADKARGTNSGKMGLGLAICKALVTAQGGTISVESAGKDQGTTMVISLERAEME